MTMVDQAASQAAGKTYKITMISTCHVSWEDDAFMYRYAYMHTTDHVVDLPLFG